LINSLGASAWKQDRLPALRAEAVPGLASIGSNEHRTSSDPPLTCSIRGRFRGNAARVQVRSVNSGVTVCPSPPWVSDIQQMPQGRQTATNKDDSCCQHRDEGADCRRGEVWRSSEMTSSAGSFSAELEFVLPCYDGTKTNALKASSPDQQRGRAT